MIPIELYFFIVIIICSWWLSDDIQEFGDHLRKKFFVFLYLDRENNPYTSIKEMLYSSYQNNQGGIQHDRAYPETTKKS